MTPSVVIVAGHAIYQDGAWHGGEPGEEPRYEQHVEAGVRLHRELPGSYLVFTGGHTRKDVEAVRTGKVTNSEAEGMLEYARRACPNLDTDRIILEEWARDSFENVFFSWLAYFKRFGTWPAAAYVVSWPWKANRFYLIACGLKLAEGRFFFRGEGDLVSQQVVERVTRANVAYEQGMVRDGKILDPLHRSKVFGVKRRRRMPAEYGEYNARYMEAVRQAYDRDGVRGLIDTVECSSPGERWRRIVWPWSSPGTTP